MKNIFFRRGLKIKRLLFFILPQGLLWGAFFFVFGMSYPLYAQNNPTPEETSTGGQEGNLELQLQKLEEQVQQLNKSVHELYELFEVAYEVRKSDPQDVSDSFESLTPQEQLEWRIAYLKGYKQTLITVYDAVSNESPEKGSSSIHAQLIRFADSYEAFQKGLEDSTDNVFPEAFQARSAKLSEHWQLLEQRFQAFDISPESLESEANSQYSSEELQALILPRGGFFSPLSTQEGLKSEASAYLPMRLIDRNLSEIRSVRILFDSFFLERLQRLIDPVERLHVELEFRRDQLELERLRKLDDEEAGEEEKGYESQADLSKPAKIKLDMRRFESERESLSLNLADAYQSYAQRAQELGEKVSAEELFTKDLEFKLFEGSLHKLMEQIQVVSARIPSLEGKTLKEWQGILEQELGVWQDQLYALVAEDIKNKPGNQARLALLGGQYRAKNQRKLELVNTIRREEARLHVSRTLLIGSAKQIYSLDKRLELLQDRWESEALGFYGWALLKVFIILLSAWIVLRFAVGIANRLVKRLSTKSQERDDPDQEDRLKTLSGVLVGSLRVVVWVTAFFMVLGEFEINYQPLLLATGGVTLAIGFGAQWLVKDLVAGFYILFENQFTVGDVIEVGGKSGSVEAVNLRSTKLRSLDGTVHIIPNGSISSVSNMTHLWSRFVVIIGVGYNEDPDEIRDILNRLGQEFYDDPEWKEKLLEPPIVLGLDEFSESSVDFKVAGKTRSGDQWAAKREYRRRVKLAFDLEGIEIPFRYVNYIEMKPGSPKALKRLEHSSLPPAQAHQKESEISSQAIQKGNEKVDAEKDPGKLPSSNE